MFCKSLAFHSQRKLKQTHLLCWGPRRLWVVQRGEKEGSSGGRSPLSPRSGVWTKLPSPIPGTLQTSVVGFVRSESRRKVCPETWTQPRKAVGPEREYGLMGLMVWVGRWQLDGLSKTSCALTWNVSKTVSLYIQVCRGRGKTRPHFKGACRRELWAQQRLGKLMTALRCWVSHWMPM